MIIKHNFNCINTNYQLRINYFFLYKKMALRNEAEKSIEGVMKEAVTGECRM